MPKRETIIDIIAAKTWKSTGAVINTDPKFERFYPKWGVKFIPRTIIDEQQLPPREVPTWYKGADGKLYKDTPVYKSFRRKLRFIRFTIDQTEIASPDNPDTLPADFGYPRDFIDKFNAIAFIEFGDNHLVSRPITGIEIKDPVNGDKIYSVTFVVELWKHNPNDPDEEYSMMQKSIWSEDYIGYYCCK